MSMLPEEFRKNMKELLGEEKFRLFEDSYSEEPVQALRINPLKKRSDDAIDIRSLLNLQKIPFEESGYYFDPGKTPGRRPFHDAGVYYIQDPGAMVPGSVLTGSELFQKLSEGENGLKVIDLCASPGGKSTQIAQAMAGKGLLVSNEINRSRADVLAGNIERMGITNALVLNESTDRLADRFEGYFDAVVVEIPDAIYLVKVQLPTDDLADLTRWLEGDEDDGDEGAGGGDSEGNTLPDDNIAQYSDGSDSEME